MSKTTKENIKPYNVWYDFSAPGQEFSHPEFLKRLKEVYGIDPKTTKGTRSMRMHVDGDTWFSYEWDWEIAGKKFVDATRDNRTGENLAMWS